MTSAEYRYLMAAIVTASNPWLSVSRVGIECGGTTYTIDTLRDLRRAHSDTDFFLITDADALPQILEWKDSDDLWSITHFIGVTRAGHQLDTADLPPEGIMLMEVSAAVIPSTDCRTRVAPGVQPRHLVSNGVVQYIARYRLYKEIRRMGSLARPWAKRRCKTGTSTSVGQTETLERRL